MRSFIMLLVVLAGGVVQAGEGALPGDAPVKPEAGSAVLVPGQHVRVELGEAREVSGALVEVGPDVLVLQEEQLLNLVPSEVLRLSVKRRRVWQGTLVGSGVGAVGLGVFGAVLCAIANGEGEGASVPLCAGAFALGGGVLGAGVGALLGLAVPRWDTVYERSQDGQVARLSLGEESVGVLSRWFSHPGPVGELGAQVGYARELDVEDAGGAPGARLHLLARLGDVLALGPEVAWYPIPARTVLTPGGTEQGASRQLFQLGGLLRAGVELGPVRPSALVGLAFSQSRTVEFAAYSVGAEVEFRPWSHLPPLAVEGRYHDNLQELAGPDPRFLTLGVGTRLKW